MNEHKNELIELSSKHQNEMESIKLESSKTLQTQIKSLEENKK